MSSEFFDSFNAALPEFERDFGATWIFGGVDYSAINIEDITLTRAVGAPGGPLAQASVVLDVARDVFEDSGVKKGSKIAISDNQFRVLTIKDQPNEQAVQLICGPIGAALQ